MQENQTPEQSQPETQVGHDIVMPAEPTEDPQISQERQAFERYVKEQGDTIPSNFKSASDWFNSLKQAQSSYTKGQQEIAELKAKYNDTGVENPNYDPQAKGQPETVPAPEPVRDVSSMPDELVITEPAPEPVTGVSQEDWIKWGKEIDANGDLSEATKQEAAKRLNADSVVVEQMIKGRQAMQKQAFDQSAQVVGGADNLKTILKWAGENLPKQEIEAMNRAMQTDASQSVLFGLKARFDAANPPAQASQPEPTVSSPNAMSAGQISRPGIEAQAFNSEAEMKSAIADPRYRTDPTFRSAVEQRILISHKHGYKR